MNEVALRANDVLRNDVMLRINDVALRFMAAKPPLIEAARLLLHIREANASFSLAFHSKVCYNKTGKAVIICLIIKNI